MKDDSAPATKADITALMASIGKLYDANVRWKDEIVRHFDVTIETIRHDLVGAHTDQVESLKKRQSDQNRRITRIEMRIGIGG